MKAEHPWRIFVYIVESPSAEDVQDNRSEGSLIQRALTLIGIDSHVLIAVDRTRFREALQKGFFETWIEKGGKNPLLHISAHGTGQGLQLTNGDFVSWAELRGLLVPLNRAMNGNLMVSMSSCSGYTGCMMAMSADADLPFLLLVGNTGKPTWSETAIAYMTFYHHVFRGSDLSVGISAMKAASGNDQFKDVFGFHARQCFLNFVDNPKSLPEVENKMSEDGNSPKDS